MAVSTTATRASFSGDGSTTAFAFPYEYRASADLKVVVVTAANVATLKTLTTHYSVSGVSDSHGGYSSATVTMVTAPASGETLVIYRSPSPVQAADVESDNDPLYALNNALDLSTYLIQHLYNDALKLPIGVTSSFSNVLPDLPSSDGYTYYLGPSSARTSLSWLTATTGTVAVSSAMSAVVTAASLSAARTAMGVPGLADANAWTAVNTFTSTTAATHPGVFKNTTDAASVAVLKLEGDRATMGANDEIYVSAYLSNSAGTQTEFARVTYLANTLTAGAEVGNVLFGLINSGTLANRAVLTPTAFRPNANDGISLGTATVSFADFFLASGGVINWSNGTYTLTQNGSLLSASGTFQARVPLSSETTGTLTTASANKKVACSGGITIPNSVFTADDFVLFDPGTSNRTFTRSSTNMYVNGTDSASATLSSNQMGTVHFRTATAAVLSGSFS